MARFVYIAVGVALTQGWRLIQEAADAFAAAEEARD